MAILNKVPPPPPIAQFDPAFNRWLHDLQAFINEGGGTINPDLIPGYDALVNTVNLHTIEINTNTINTAANTSAIAFANAKITLHTTQIGILNTEVATLTTDVATLTARPIVRNGTTVPGGGLGANGDWYADTNNLHIYVKVSGSWVLII
jgi:hypothetical protein